MKPALCSLQSLGLILVLLVTLCLARPGWRPQGRFGKRLSAEEPSDLGFFMSPDVPVEVLFSKAQLARMETKPRLCSWSGLYGYPLCDTQPSRGVAGDAGDLLNSYYGLR